MIKKYKLIQNEELKITQKQYFYSENIKEEEETNTGKIIGREFEKEYKINFNEHIEEREFEIKVDRLDENEKEEINKLLQQYKSVFAKDKYDVGTVKGYEARIDLSVD